MKRILLLFAILFLSINSWSFKSGNFEYKILDQKQEISLIWNLNLTSDSIIIPSSIYYNNQNYTVSSISGGVFKYNEYLKYLYMPPSVRKIDCRPYELFRDCRNIITIELSPNITDLPEGTFCGCRHLTTIKLPPAIKHISARLFYDCSSLMEIKIPELVTQIKEEAFYNCESLKRVELPTSLTDIDSRAFAFCEALKEIKIPESVISIGENAFYNCTSLTDIVLPDSIKKIEKHTFAHCSSLKEIKIPASVITIEEGAFLDCSAFIIVDPANPTYASIDGVLYNKDKTELISYPNKAGEFKIPNTVTKIKKSAFENRKALNKITIPNTVSLIEEEAFQGCTSLKEINLPPSVSSIGSNTFKNCSSLKRVKIPQGVESIGAWAFDSCLSLQSIKLPNTITQIEQNAFSNCSSLKEIKLPPLVNSIKANTFAYCTNLIRINFHDNNSVNKNTVKQIDTQAFSNCIALKKISLPSSLENLGWGVFENCTSLKTITIPDSISELDATFYGCSSLKTVKLPRNLSNIEDKTFENCTSIDTLHFSSKVNDIYIKALINCSAYMLVDRNNPKYSSVNGHLYYIESTTLLINPHLITDTMFIPDSIKKIGCISISGQSKIKYVYIHKNINEIALEIDNYEVNNSSVNFIVDDKSENYASKDGALFNKKQTKLLSVPNDKMGTYIVPNGVDSVESYALKGCNKLLTIALPPSVKLINESNFEYLGFVENIHIYATDAPSILRERLWPAYDAPLKTLKLKSLHVQIGCKDKYSSYLSNGDFGIITDDLDLKNSPYNHIE